MNTLRGAAFAAGLVLGLAFKTAYAATEISGLRFSNEEVALLKDLDRIQSGAGVASSMLKAAPFIQLFSSPNPVDVAITITTNDWDKILGAIQALQKIAACKTSETIAFWKDVDGNNYSSKKSEEFFSQILSKADAEC